MRTITVEMFDSNGNVVGTREEQAPPVLITAQDFFERFTPQEILAIYRSTDDMAEYLQVKLFTRRDMIDLDSPDIVQAMELFISLGLVTPERASQIRSL